MKTSTFSLLLLLPLIFFTAKVNSAQPDASLSNINFQHYEARLTPDFEDKSVTGSVNITFRVKKHHTKQLKFNAQFKQIKNIQSPFSDTEFEVVDDKLIITFDKYLVTNQNLRLNIVYEAKPERGMRFYDDHLFTLYHTSNWLIAHKNIDDKATFELKLIHDQQLTSIGNGQLVSQRVLNDKQIESHWRQLTPMPTYTFGFAVGQFEQIQRKQGEQTINYFYRPYDKSKLNKGDINTIYADVFDMVDFFQSKSGLTLPEDKYTYVMVAGRMAQEAAGYSLVGEKFGHVLLQDENENWFVAHEIAHQWWGNNITSQHFGDFWLNEGLVQFLVAAYKEHRFGPQAYEREIQLALDRVHRAGKRGKSGPVALQQPIDDSQINHSMVYNKGALVFHMLRKQLGEKKFWQAIKQYSQLNKDSSVTTSDLQQTFEQVAKQDLSNFFNKWVYDNTLPKQQDIFYKQS